MKIPPKYTVTAEMLSLISQIEAKKIYFSSLNLPLNVKEQIIRVSLLKSSLFSARIEGNPLELSDLESKDAEQEKKQEIFNIIDAISLLDTKLTTGMLTKDLLLELHNCILKSISPDAGCFRKEVSAIFNQSGIAVYVPPPPF